MIGHHIGANKWKELDVIGTLVHKKGERTPEHLQSAGPSPSFNYPAPSFERNFGSTVVMGTHSRWLPDIFGPGCLMV